MARVFISGSSTGLGLMAGQLLAEQGHRVVLHARNDKRANDARRALSRTEVVVTGDLETIAGAKDVAAQVNGLGRFDAVILLRPREKVHARVSKSPVIGELRRTLESARRS